MLIVYGFKLSAITSDTLSILTNREIIAINQDPVYGESISPFRWGINVRTFAHALTRMDTESYGCSRISHSTLRTLRNTGLGEAKMELVSVLKLASLIG